MTDSNGLDQRRRALCGELWAGSQARTLLDTISYECGSRHSGSAGIQKAHRFLTDRLNELHPDRLALEPVDLLIWNPGAAELRISGWEELTTPCVQMVHSAAGKVSGTLVDAGFGFPDDLKRLGDKLRGNIALMQGSARYAQQVRQVWERVPEMVKLGVIGVVVKSLYTNSGPEVYTAGFEQAVPFPVVSISSERGAALTWRVQREKVQATIQTTGFSRPGRCFNMVADFDPAQPSDETIILTAHLDCHYISSGTLDNLSGVVMAMELVRALVQHRGAFRRGLRLLLLTGEEYGFIGSRAYIRQHAKELDQIRLDFNMDCIFPETARGTAVMWSPRMGKHIDDAYKRCECQVEVHDHFCMSSDYLPFMLAGIPAARPADFWDRFPQAIMHTFADTPDRLPTDWIRLNTLNHGQMLLTLLTRDELLPSVRRDRQEVQPRISQMISRV